VNGSGSLKDGDEFESRLDEANIEIGMMIADLFVNNADRLGRKYGLGVSELKMTIAHAMCENLGCCVGTALGYELSTGEKIIEDLKNVVTKYAESALWE
jgi:hypothetical protein